MKTIGLFSKINRAKRGFTLVEMLIVIAITAILGTILTSAMSQIVMINASSNSHMEAIKQVENALHYVNRDVQASQTVSVYQNVGGVYTLKTGNLVTYDLAKANGDKLSLTWTDWDSKNNTIDYWIINQSLHSKHTVVLGGVTQSETQAILARYISQAMGDWNVTSKSFTLNITAALPGFPAGETRTLTLRPRPAQ